MDIADFTLRRLDATSDTARFREIRLEALRSAPEAFGADYASEKARPLAWFGERLETSEVIGGFLAERLAGSVGVGRQAGANGAHKAYLWGLFVRPEARGLGVARQLVEAAIAGARGRFEILQLTVARPNQPARRLFTDLGFREYGLEKDARKVRDRYIDDILMALDLRPD